MVRGIRLAAHPGSMAILTRNRVAEGILSVSSLGILVAVMSTLDENVRKEVTTVLTGDTGSHLEMAASSAHSTMLASYQTVFDFVHVNTPMVAFSVVAVVLLL